MPHLYSSSPSHITSSSRREDQASPLAAASMCSRSQNLRQRGGRGTREALRLVSQPAVVMCKRGQGLGRGCSQQGLSVQRRGRLSAVPGRPW